MRPLAPLLALVGFFATTPVVAQSYARPPDEPVQVVSSYDRPDYRDDYDAPPWRPHELSPFRVHIGGAGRIQSDDFTPGLLVAVDIGRGPAGFRASGMWLRVGSDDGLAQYTGELTLDLGTSHRWRPVLGAGAGLARTYRIDEAGNRTSGGSSLGVGVLRAGIDYLLPVEKTDARASLSAVGVLPALRGEGAPDSDPWLVVLATVAVGF